MKARVTVTLKSGILDPQGKAIEGALKSLGVAGIEPLLDLRGTLQRHGHVFRDVPVSMMFHKLESAPWLS